MVGGDQKEKRLSKQYIGFKQGFLCRYQTEEGKIQFPVDYAMNEIAG
jgi:hypothetical protein